VTKSYPLIAPDEVWEPLVQAQPEETNRNDHINAALARYLVDYHADAIEERFDEDLLDDLREVAYDGD
jgi:hypothetical protein